LTGAAAAATDLERFDDAVTAPTTALLTTPERGRSHPRIVAKVDDAIAGILSAAPHQDHPQLR
jgi:ribosomal 50S subunit-associated protein YjgA (DUF615 family)